MRISDWSSDVCSSDLSALHRARDAESDRTAGRLSAARGAARPFPLQAGRRLSRGRRGTADRRRPWRALQKPRGRRLRRDAGRSEEHTSELQSLMRISYAVFCLKKKTTNPPQHSRYTKNEHTILLNTEHND